MPVKLRLKRQGRRKTPHYAIVAADARSPRDGRFIEKIGTYNPIAQPGQVYVDHELALKWLQVGAQPTNTVRSLLRHAGVTLKFALIKQGKDEETIQKIFDRWEAEKRSKKKKKIVIIDRTGQLLEEVPEAPKPVKKEPEAAPAPDEVAPAVTEEAATVVEEVVEAAEEVAVAAVEKVTEVAAAVAEVAEEVVEAAVEEVTEVVAEVIEEEAPAAEETPAKEEKPAEEA